MKYAIALLLLIAAGCRAPQPVRVHPISIGASVHPVVCPAGQVAFYAVGHPEEPLVHRVIFVSFDGRQKNTLEVCDH